MSDGVTKKVTAQLNLFEVQVHIPVVSVRQPDGSLLLRPGKPVIVEDEISVTEAARLLGMSTRWVNNQCSLGRFKSAYQPGARPKAAWRLSRAEVLARRQAPAD
jgi:hypothetical protein